LGLCRDEVWGVRKACAEVFLSVACTCSLHTREYSLTPAFSELLADASRWVRMAAFCVLGPFISTFAEPPITGLAYNHLRELVLVNPHGAEF
jgi:serine/threonine-protein phosphatase 4 regulatory subunit 1